MAEPAGAILVTGGAGYVGAPTVRRLAAGGRRVVVLDDLSTGHADAVRDAPLVEADVGDRDALRTVIAEHGVSAVIHCAAKALVGESMDDPGLYDRENRAKTEVLAQVAAEAGLRAVVFSSTCSVYGVPEDLPITETAPRRPVNPYGISKAACEDALPACGVPTLCLRYFNAAGAEPEHGLGERHDPETHLVPRAIAAARGGETLVILGTDHPTPDGTCVRDYVHVSDLAAAHEAALAHLEGGGRGGALNLGTGRGASVREVVEAVGRAVGRPVACREGPPRPGDPPALVAAADRAEQVLGWRAVASDLDRIVADAVAFARLRETSAGRGS